MNIYIDRWTKLIFLYLFFIILPLSLFLGQLRTCKHRSVCQADQMPWPRISESQADQMSQPRIYENQADQMPQPRIYENQADQIPQPRISESQADHIAQNL